MGLFLANECARRGLNYRLIKHARRNPSTRLAIFPRTLEIFDMAGVVGPFMEAANPVTAVAVIAHGRRLAHMQFAPEESPYRLIAMVPQNVTEKLLAEQLQRRGGVVAYDTSFVSAVQHDDGVSVVLDRKGERLELGARFLVGCDGAHSAVRHLLNLPFEGMQYEDSFLLADVETNEALRRTSCSCVPANSGRRRSFRCLPLGDGSSRRSSSGRQARRSISCSGFFPARTSRDRGARAPLEQLFPHPSSACRAAAGRAVFAPVMQRTSTVRLAGGHEYRAATSGILPGSSISPARPWQRSCSSQCPAVAGHQAGDQTTHFLTKDMGTPTGSRRRAATR